MVSVGTGVVRTTTTVGTLTLTTSAMSQSMHASSAGTATGVVVITTSLVGILILTMSTISQSAHASAAAVVAPASTTPGDVTGLGVGGSDVTGLVVVFVPVNTVGNLTLTKSRMGLPSSSKSTSPKSGIMPPSGVASGSGPAGIFPSSGVGTGSGRAGILFLLLSLSEKRKSSMSASSTSPSSAGSNGGSDVTFGPKMSSSNWLPSSSNCAVLNAGTEGETSLLVTVESRGNS